MLEEINISNLGIIKESKLDFSPGLNVITGETGAGKTMVLSALHLLLGKRGSANMIHKDAKTLSVEGCWNLSKSPYTTEIEDTGALIEDDQLFINRTVKSDGKSRCVVGGKTTPASVLSGLGSKLVNIHGQADQNRLRSPLAQREVLDKYAGEDLSKELKKYSKVYKLWKEQKAHIEDVQKNSSSRKRELNSLKKFMSDFDEVNPTENQDEELENLISSLSNVDAIRVGGAEALAEITMSDSELPSAESQLSNMISALASIMKYDSELEAIHDKADKVADDLSEVVSELESYLTNIDTDSIEQLYNSQEQLTEIKALVRKYGNSLSEVIELRDKADSELEILESYSQPIEELKEELDETFKKLLAAADAVTKIRVAFSKKLEKAVNKELEGLSMGGSSLKVSIAKVSPTSSGQDEVELTLLSKGSKKANPITKSASGGELSRIMLALEVVLADPKNTGTFIFDEVDSGIGGETAIEIGKRLALLAKEAQVIVVTHLPQVACFGDSHLKVSKSESEDSIETSVQKLDNEETTLELTRMLSGMSDSETGKAHAIELMDYAKSFKNA